MRLAFSLAGFRDELDKIAEVVSEETQLESYGPQSTTFAAAPAPVLGKRTLASATASAPTRSDKEDEVPPPMVAYAR